MQNKGIFKSRINKTTNVETRDNTALAIVAKRLEDKAAKLLKRENRRVVKSIAHAQAVEKRTPANSPVEVKEHLASSLTQHESEEKKESQMYPGKQLPEDDVYGITPEILYVRSWDNIQRAYRITGLNRWASTNKPFTSNKRTKDKVL